MKVAGGDGGNVTPRVNRALPTAIVPHGNGGPISSETYRMPVSTSHRDYLPGAVWIGGFRSDTVGGMMETEPMRVFPGRDAPYPVC